VGLSEACNERALRIPHEGKTSGKRFIRPLPGNFPEKCGRVCRGVREGTAYPLRNAVPVGLNRLVTATTIQYGPVTHGFHFGR
jgi:hypothetical protein